MNDGNDYIYGIIHDVNGMPYLFAKKEILYCRNCKYWTNNINDPNLRNNFCGRREAGNYFVCSGNDYCSHGERMAESEDD